MLRAANSGRRARNVSSEAALFTERLSGEGSSMSLGARVAANLPYLRRYARALTGSQATGDAFVRETLEAALADDELRQMIGSGRAELHHVF